MPPPGPPKSGSKGWLIAVIVGVVLLVFCGGAGVAGVLVLRTGDSGSSSANGGSTTTPSPVPSPVPSLSPSPSPSRGDNGSKSAVTVRMEVTADDGIILISWGTLAHKDAQVNPDSPWTKEIDLSDAGAVGVVVSGRGSVKCKITVGGELREERQAKDHVTCATYVHLSIR